MRKARIGFCLWIGFVIFFYLWTASPAALVILAGSGCIPVLGAVLVLLCGRKCGALLSIPDAAGKGEPVCIELNIKNHSLFPVCKCRILLECNNILTGEHLEFPAVFSLWPKGSADMRVKVENPHCGLFTCRIKEAAVMDLFSIYKKRVRIQAGTEAYVMPQVREIHLSDEEMYAYNMESDQYASDRKGNDPGDTFEIREYEEGDSLKAIHWKLTGKMGDLMVREPGLPVESSIMILLEKGMEKEDLLTAEQREKAAELFLSLSHTLLEHRISHTAGWQDYRNGQFMLRRIADMEDLWAMSGLVMGSPYEEDPVPAHIHYLEHSSKARFARYFYVTAGSSRSMNGLENYGAVTVYRP